MVVLSTVRGGTIQSQDTQSDTSSRKAELRRQAEILLGLGCLEAAIQTGIVVEAALAWAATIGPVFPIRPPGDAQDGKHPYTRHGFYDATTDEAQIREWLQKWPDCNIGLRMGNGLVCIDVDGTEGIRELENLQRQQGHFPKTLTQRTGRGFHFVFSTAAPIPSSTLARGMHVKGELSYIVAAPSRHKSGCRYTIEHLVPPAPLPEWVAEAMAAAPKMRAATGGRPPRGEDTSDIRKLSRGGNDRITARIKRDHPEIAGPIPEGTRNDTIFRRVACRMRARGADYSDIVSAASDINGHHCQPPLPNTEVRKTVRSACRYPRGTKRAPLNVGEFLDEFEHAVSQLRWPGHKGNRQLALLRAIFGIVQETGKLEFHLSIRQAAERAGLSRSVAHRAIKDLQTGDHRWLVQTRGRLPDYDVDGSEYRLTIPTQLRRNVHLHLVSSGRPEHLPLSKSSRGGGSRVVECPSKRQLSKNSQVGIRKGVLSRMQGHHSLFLGLGQRGRRRRQCASGSVTAARIVAALELGTYPGVTALAKATGLHRETVRGWLKRLGRLGLVAWSAKRGFERGKSTLDHAAKQHGCVGEYERRREMWQREREAYRERLAGRQLPRAA